MHSGTQGIFAFKLGYLIDKAHSMIDYKDYQDMFDRYDQMTKISFDYAVVGKGTKHSGASL